MVNKLLFPIENFIAKNKSNIAKALLCISFLLLSFIFFPSSVKSTGEQALNLLWIILFLPIFAKVFGISLAQVIMPLRKELGILMGTLAFVHGGGYILSYPKQILESYFWYSNGSIAYTAVGFFALVFTIPLVLTSNKFAIKKLGKLWKKLHKIAYLVLVLTLLHVALIKLDRGIDIFPIILFILYFFGKILEWKKVSLVAKKEYPKGQKWFCVPCGFIYDPLTGDADSGILPGTEFSDIADDWSCPVCGVGKSDFVPYDENHIPGKSIDVQIVEKKMLNDTTLELSIETKKKILSLPGQFVSFLWEDALGNFIRSYSIAKHEGNIFTFLIKIDANGRGGKMLQKIGKGDTLHIRGVFGEFILKNTKRPKVFIATGTGLAPIYNMLTEIPEKQKKLYFSVSTKGELFYEDEIHSLQNLESHIHITRENTEGYQFGRIDIHAIDAQNDTEWYLCGNPKMIEESKKILESRGFTHIFTEEFS